jgi:hypothetical protein
MSRSWVWIRLAADKPRCNEEVAAGLAKTRTRTPWSRNQYKPAQCASQTTYTIKLFGEHAGVDHQRDADQFRASAGWLNPVSTGGKANMAEQYRSGR